MIQLFGGRSSAFDHGSPIFTRDSWWWARRGEFDMYSSRLVVQECQAGDPQAAADRLTAMAGIPWLEQTAEITQLTKALLRGVPLPAKAASDALHIAIAAVHGMQYLLTWDCTHIANAALRPRIETECRTARHQPPLICTPQELLSEDSDND
jgi:hypothetical protein